LQHSYSEQTPRLPVEPIRHFQQESVSRMQLEKIADVSLEVFRSFSRQKSLSTGIPDSEQRRAGEIFPAEHHVGLQLLEVESARIACDCGIRIWCVAIVIIISSWI